MQVNLFIINPKSFFFNQSKIGRFIQDAKIALSELGKEGVFHISRFSRDAIWVVKKHLAAIRKTQKTDTLRVYAVGGDGILFDCLNAVLGEPNVQLASVPWGRQNDFVRSFGEDAIPVFRKLSRLVEAPTIKTDVIACSGNYAICHCCIGLEAYSNYLAIGMNDHMVKLGRLWTNKLYNSMDIFAGFYAAFTEIAHQKYRIVLDDYDYSGDYGLINISNTSPYGGELCAVPSAVPNDGFLDVLMYKSNAALHTLRVINPYLHGNWWHFPGDFVYKQAHKITIYSEDHPLCVILDSEQFWEQELNIELLPGAVDIVVPEGLNYVNWEEKHNRDKIQENRFFS